ncbi:MAG TPA: hypothetical protein VGN59_13245 [Acidimicrobiia bacterium]|jgi:hypothetical protein
MSRKTKSRPDVLDDDVLFEHDDPHGFWDVDRLDAEDNDDAFALVIEDHEDEPPPERATLVYMGSVDDEVDAIERSRLADWVASKACRSCRRRYEQYADTELVKHDGCRNAFAVEQVLRRG